MTLWCSRSCFSIAGKAQGMLLPMRPTRGKASRHRHEHLNEVTDLIP
jgi:hypothetical protein